MVTLETIREEHDELRPWLESLLLTADRVGDAPFETLKEMVDEVYEFLVAHLIPHAEAEEDVLYPAVERVSGAAGLMQTMSRDHTEVKRLTAELSRYREHLALVTPGHFQEKGLRRVLYGLSTLVRVHFAKEEETLLPLLERTLSENEADQMLAALAESEQTARARAIEHAHPGGRLLPA